MGKLLTRIASLMVLLAVSCSVRDPSVQAPAGRDMELLRSRIEAGGIPSGISSGEEAAASGTGFDTGKASFSVQINDELCPYRVLGVFVLPEDEVTLEVMEGNLKNQYLLAVSQGTVARKSEKKWVWQAPRKTGLIPMEIQDAQTRESMTLNVFVMAPYDDMEGEYLNGYRIGKYPRTPLRQLPVYNPPGGFVEVTKENEETPLSPHFTLKQFLCRQESGYPKYLVLRERLLLKLELILEKINEKGCPAGTLQIMSGFRSPYYNQSLGNVKYSSHIYGVAADLFVDENPKDGMMDDLNRDGRVDYGDAGFLYDVIDEMEGEPRYEPFVGGLGKYKKSRCHGPFIHVDARGFRVRWGK